MPDSCIIYKTGFAVWLEIHPLLPEACSLCNQPSYVVASFIFRAVRIVQSRNKKLGHTFFLSASFLMDSKLTTS